MEHSETINQWENGLHIRHIAHSLAFSYYNSADKVVGLLSTLLTALVSSAIFASISKASPDKTSNDGIIVIAGVISIVATLFSAANAFLKYGELAARHNQAVASFGSLRRELETTLMNTTVSITADKMDDFNAKWTKLEETVPAIPQRIYNKASRRVHRTREAA